MISSRICGHFEVNGIVSVSDVDALFLDCYRWRVDEPNIPVLSPVEVQSIAGSLVE